MVCLNLPVETRYLEENMYLVGIIPGPQEPSLEQINHVIRPLVDDLLKFWETGVFVKATPRYPDGRLVRCALVPLVCDLPAARQMGGFASHAAIHFCSFCDLSLREIDNLDEKTWPMRTREGHMEAALKWKNARSETQRLNLFNESGVRYSELLRLPYWDPTRFTVLDTMHSLLLGDLKLSPSPWVIHSSYIALIREST
ncbi:hypothetical protein BV25DRAFT_1873315 [Artomyces pyxidatus]|uniref:Uncharacterized protein n=1 Tax=Artomyces pyxidatus TaxID=48021 RepID=A0ACB8SFM2_9AGAM|nr:hypothetical protein BV25DRAFT_1873315 [Artomyces pyxidatus]